MPKRMKDEIAEINRQTEALKELREDLDVSDGSQAEKKADPFPMYEDLAAYLRELPMTWYPALILEMVEAAYRKKTFVKGGASRFIAQHEEKMDVL